MAGPTKLLAGTCLFLCPNCDIGMHEYCRDREKCQCTFPTWDELGKKAPGQEKGKPRHS